MGTPEEEGREESGNGEDPRLQPTCQGVMPACACLGHCTSHLLTQEARWGCLLQGEGG